jgi:hypothetical protein
MSMSTLGLKQVRRAVIFVVGMTVLLLGVALIVLPGPAIVVIPMGLAILGLEFRWARRWMQRARSMIQSGRERVLRSNKSSPSSNAVKPSPPQNTPGGDANLSEFLIREKEAVLD